MNQKIYDELGQATTQKFIEKVFEDAISWGAYPGEVLKTYDAGESANEEDEDMNSKDMMMMMAVKADLRTASVPEPPHGLLAPLA